MALKVCVITYPHYMKVLDGGNVIEGLLADLLISVANHLNFTFITRDVLDKAFAVGNSTVSEIYYMLHRGECDFFWAPMGVSYEISRIVDITVPILEAPTIIFSVINKSNLPGATWNVLSGNPKVILALFAALSFLGFLTYVIERKVFHVHSDETSLENLQWAYFGTLFLEPFQYHFHNPSRIISAVWWLSIIVIVSQFGGNLKATLSVQNQDTIESLSDILAKPHLRPIIAKGVRYAHLMKASTEKDISEVYQRSVRMKGLVSFPELFKRSVYSGFLNGSSVVLMPEIGSYVFLRRHCTTQRNGMFYISKNSFMETMHSITFRKGFSPKFKEQLNRRLIYFVAMKTNVHDSRASMRKFSDCFWKPQTGYQHGNDIIFLCVLWTCGMSVSAVVLLMEIIIHRFVHS